MKITKLHPWDLDIPQAAEIQQQLRTRLVLRPPDNFSPTHIAGADVSMDKNGDKAFAGIVILDVLSLQPIEEATAIAPLSFPYVPGFLSFRELPAVVEAWGKLQRRPDVVIFDGQGYAHPRRMGIASHGGLLLDIPSIGCAKSLLVGRHDPLDEAKGSQAPIIHQGEIVGMAIRLRAGVQPVYISPGHLMDLPTAIATVRSVATRFREPETTRHAHRLVNRIRKERHTPR